MMESATGLMVTLVNVYSNQRKQWSITAIITASTIGVWLVVAGALYILYSYVLLPRLKASRWRTVSQDGRARGS